MSNVKRGDWGHYPRNAKPEDRRAVKVTRVSEDGKTVDISALDENKGKNGAGVETTNPNPWYRENVPADDFVPHDETEEQAVPV